MADQTARPIPRRAHDDPPWIRRTLICIALFVMFVLVVVPLVDVFVEAFAGGAAAYWNNLVNDADTLHSIMLTLMVAPMAVILNVIFGLAAAWAIARFKFPGRAALTALIDLPFTVSPVVVGLFLCCSSDCKASSGRGCASTTSRSSSRSRARDRHLLRHLPRHCARADSSDGGASGPTRRSRP